MYPIILKLHLAVIAISLVLYLCRFVFALAGSRLSIHPVAVKSAGLLAMLVLITAAALCVTIGQYPFLDGWLTEKLIGLLIYIVMGIASLKPTTARPAQLLYGVIALTAFAGTFMVARLHAGFFL